MLRTSLARRALCPDFMRGTQPCVFLKENRKAIIYFLFCASALPCFRDYLIPLFLHALGAFCGGKFLILIADNPSSFG